VFIFQKQKTATGGRALAVLLKINLLRCLFCEIQHPAAVVEHEQQCGEEKQTHKNVEDAIAFAPRILDIFHDVLRCCGC
jgi:hypothetical protein